MTGGDQGTGEPSSPATEAMEETGDSGSPTTEATEKRGEFGSPSTEEMEETGESVSPANEEVEETAGSTATDKMDQQFSEFRDRLDMAEEIRKIVRALALEIDGATRRMHSTISFVHRSVLVTEVLEMANSDLVLLKELFGTLVEALSKFSPVQYFRYHGDWRSEMQRVVSLLAFMHWLETGTLLLHSKAEQDLGLNSLVYGLDIEDYLIGLCLMSNELLRYVVNQVRIGDYVCPREALKFLTDVHTSFNLMNLRNEFLRKKFDGIMVSELRKLEQVNYDVEIRGLPTKWTNGQS